MRYLWSMFIVSFFFGLQQDGKYHKIVICMGFIHFAAELEPIHYLLWSPRVAKTISYTTYFIFIMEAIAVWFVGNNIYYVFNFQFIFSDLFNFTVSIMFIFHPETNYKLWKMCVAFSMHYVGVLWAFTIGMYSRFYDSSMTLGFGWAAIGLSSLLQLYLLRSFITRNEQMKIPKIKLIR